MIWRRIIHPHHTLTVWHISQKKNSERRFFFFFLQCTMVYNPLNSFYNFVSSLLLEEKDRIFKSFYMKNAFTWQLCVCLLCIMMAFGVNFILFYRVQSIELNGPLMIQMCSLVVVLIGVLDYGTRRDFHQY